MAEFNVPFEDLISEFGATIGSIKKGEINRAVLGQLTRGSIGTDPATEPTDPVGGAASEDPTTWVFDPRTPKQIKENLTAISAKIFGDLKIIPSYDGKKDDPASRMFPGTPADDPEPTELKKLFDDAKPIVEKGLNKQLDDKALRELLYADATFTGLSDTEYGKIRDVQVKYAVWREMAREGGCNSVQTGDGPKITWGRGFNMLWAGKNLMNLIFSKAKYAEVKEKFRDFGIHYEGGNLIVAMSFEKKIESTSNAQANLHMRDCTDDGTANGKRLFIAAWVAVTEASSAMRQSVADAMFECIMAAGMAGAIQPEARNWPLKLIQIVAHQHHFLSAFGWKAKYLGEPLWTVDTNTIEKVLKALGRARGKLTRSQAVVLNGGNDKQIIDQFRGNSGMKGWGDGIAWEEIQKGCPAPLQITDKQFDDPMNTSYAHHFFFPGDSGFYVYPGIDNYFEKIIAQLIDPPDKKMKQLLTEIEKYSYPQVCDLINNYTPELEVKMGVRVRIALVAVKHVKLTKKQPTTKPDKNIVINDKRMNQITEDDRKTILNYIGADPSAVPDDAIVALRDSKFDECVKILNGRPTMDSILATLDKLDIFQITTLQQNYSSAIFSKYGGRVWAAVEAARIKKSGSPAPQQTTDKNKLLANKYFTELPEDQENSIKKYLGISAAPVDEAIAKLNAEDYDGCANLLGARSMKGILDTLRPVTREKLVYFSNAFYDQNLFGKYGGRTFLAIEAIKWKTKLVEERQTFKYEYEEHYSVLPFDQKELLCAEMNISAL